MKVDKVILNFILVKGIFVQKKYFVKINELLSNFVALVQISLWISENWTQVFLI